MVSKVIQFPESIRKNVEHDRLVAGAVEGSKVGTYFYVMTDLLHELTRPYKFGWIASEKECLERRTKAQFIKMFELNHGHYDPSCLGFRDIEEGLLCDQAAIETGSAWRFLDFYREHKDDGYNGLWCLNLFLNE